MLFACGDIELNQGTKKKSSCYNISVCNWNLHSVNALNLTIIDILQAYNAMWGKVFKNGPSKICGRQPLKNLKWYEQTISLKDCFPQILLDPFLNTIYQYDMISLSESYLDLSVSFNNDNLHINGYKLVRAKHRANLKRGGVCILSNPYLWDVCLTLA